MLNLGNAHVAGADPRSVIIPVIIRRTLNNHVAAARVAAIIDIVVSVIVDAAIDAGPVARRQKR